MNLGQIVTLSFTAAAVAGAVVYNYWGMKWGIATGLVCAAAPAIVTGIVYWASYRLNQFER